MEIQELERYVTDVLTFVGYDRANTDERVYEALFHLTSAVKIFDIVTDEQKSEISNILSEKINGFLSAKILLKERKRKEKKKGEKESLPPTPPNKEKADKEKEDKEKAEKTLSLSKEKKEKFKEECRAFIPEYGEEMVKRFFEYYAQPDEKTGRMLKEDFRHWSTEARLEKWAGNSFSKEEQAAAIKLSRVKGTKPKDPVLQQQQVQAAAVREQADKQREEAQEQARQNSMTPEEYARLHPDSMLARRWRKKQEEENKNNNPKNEKTSCLKSEPTESQSWPCSTSQMPARRPTP